MRLVELDNPLKADAIMENLRSQLPHVGAKVNNPYSDIRIMSGRDEGINAWITVNYLEKKFGVHGVAPSSGQEMIGALDLGGASAQITFVPKNPSLAPHTSTRYLFGSEYYVYSYSHLCYGKSASQKRVWAEIIGNQSTATINNPCFLQNYELKVKKSEIFTEPCVKSKYAVELIGSELIPNTALPEEITLVGTGDPDQCRQFVQKMFPSKACAQSPCMFQGVYRPPLHGKFSAGPEYGLVVPTMLGKPFFTAFSGYAFVIDHLNFPTKGQNLTRDAVKAKVDEFCRRDWTQVAQEYPASSLEFIAGYCQDGVYIDALLSNYGFVDSESWKNIVFASKIAGTTVSWAPGYLIDATGMIDSESPKIDLGLTAFVTSVVILSIVFVALLVILVFLHLRN
ncbi:unnamed protein product [Mesocestoides corti]|uniref:Ectonucleoside triphosphate diphosphohydrolase 1 n=1 Tax=Mesocestoides corti TaxID=53468 RepID=A0A0R3U2T8_MESCO|nr:unnamed protein product [Mesocestoides corti]